MVTIFTPTYNRGNLLQRLYDSLKNQTMSDFEWLIVDDGSSDNTEEIVREWIDEEKIKIRYIKKENGGKHTAFNTGVQNAEGELFFCVDSDDYLPTDCVENILTACSNVESDKVAGIIGMKTDTEGYLLCGKFPKETALATAYDLTEKYQCHGEKSMIYKTEVLKKIPYPEIENEKFIGECVVYDRIDQEYTMLLLNKVLTICEYQPDGLTGAMFSTMLKNPTGYKIYHSRRIDMAHTLSKRLEHALRYNAFDLLSDDNQYNYSGKYKFLTNILRPFGWALTYYYNYKKKSME